MRLENSDFAEYHKMRELMINEGVITKEHLYNARLLACRDEYLHYLPKKMICAEVGVAYGDFSRKILDVMNPKKFYAFDYFGGDNIQDFWGKTYVKDSGLDNQTWYREKFKCEVEKGVLETRKGISWEELAKFGDRYFDFIYLDAGHLFDSVSKDIEVAKKKIKIGGILAFNDYVLHNCWIHPENQSGYYGVVPAVNHLINTTKSEVLYMTFETMLANDVVIRYLE